MTVKLFDESMNEARRYIAERGLKPFTQRPEYCQCINCMERRAADELEAAGRAIVAAFPQLLKEAA